MVTNNPQGEFQQGDEPEVPPRPIEIVRTPQYRQQPQSNSSLKMTVLVSLAVTVVVLIFLSFAGGVLFVTPKAMTDNFTKMDASLNTKLAEAIASANKKVTDAVASLQIVKTDVDKTVSSFSSDISALKTSVQTATTKANEANSKADSITSKVSGNDKTVTDLSNEVNTQKTKIASLETTNLAQQTKITEYETRIKTLEDKYTASNPVTSGQITVEYSTIGNIQMMANGISDTQPSNIAFKLKLINTTAKKAVNVQLTTSLSVYSQGTVLPQMAVGFPRIVGSNPVWSLLLFQPNYMVFSTAYGVSGLTINAGQTITLYPQLQLQSVTGQGNTTLYYFNIENVTVEDYTLQ